MLRYYKNRYLHIAKHCLGQQKYHDYCYSSYTLCNHWPSLITPPPPRTTKLWYWVHSVRPSVSPSVRPACHVRSVLSTLLDGFFPYLTQMITSMRRCATHNDLWPWPIFSRSFRHDFAIKLLKYGTSCGVHSTACTLLDGFFPYWAQIITSIRGCATHIELWP